MTYEAKPGDGALFANKNRTTDKHPNATGYVIAHRDIKAGEKLNLAAWTKTGGTGKFQSLRMSDPRTREENVRDAPASGPVLDDEIPFMPEWR